MISVIEAKSLSVNARSPNGGRVNIVDDVSLAVEAGETLGIVGESGSGKTTFVRALMALVPLAGGEVKFAGVAVDRRGRKALRRHAAMMFQDPVASLSPRMRVGSLLVEPFIIHGIRLANREAKARELLKLVGLPEAFADRYPHELSGGQARRVGVARALALEPRLVIADEPTAGLDVSVQGDILNLMMALKRSLKLSYIIVTHNLAMIRHVSEKLAIMYLGRIVEVGPTAEVFAHPLHPYTRLLIDSEPVPDPRHRRETLPLTGEIPSIFARPPGCEFHQRCPFAQEKCRSEAPPPSKMGAFREVRCHFPIQQGGLQ